MKLPPSSQADNLEPESVSSDTLGKLKWNHDAVLSLISLYKSHLNDFNSTKEKNDKIWSRLSCEMIANGFNYTAQQYKFKFKYIKSKYMQKRDNAKGTSTGEAPVKCPYFDEMDDIFGQKPNVVPPNLASNLAKRPFPNIQSREEERNLLEDEVTGAQSDESNAASTSAEPATKRRKRQGSSATNLEALIKGFQNDAQAREKERTRRHNENTQFRNKLLDSFNSKMDALINVLKNP